MPTHTKRVVKGKHHGPDTNRQVLSSWITLHSVSSAHTDAPLHHFSSQPGQVTTAPKHGTKEGTVSLKIPQRFHNVLSMERGIQRPACCQPVSQMGLSSSCAPNLIKREILNN